MSKIAVVYWSGTGNMEAMASAVLEDIQERGADGEFFAAAEFDVSMMDAYDAIAHGRPSMGGEELEDSAFAPMFSSCETKLSGKKIALFGLYG